MSGEACQQKVDKRIDMKRNFNKFLLISLIISTSCNTDKQKEEYFKCDMSGIVTKKYISFNHATKKISTTNKLDFDIGPWYGVNDLLWDAIDTGDSIYKPSNTLVLKLIKTNKEEKIYNYYSTP